VAAGYPALLTLVQAGSGFAFRARVTGPGRGGGGRLVSWYVRVPSGEVASSVPSPRTGRVQPHRWTATKCWNAHYAGLMVMPMQVL